MSWKSRRWRRTFPSARTAPKDGYGTKHEAKTSLSAKLFLPKVIYEHILLLRSDLSADNS